MIIICKNNNDDLSILINDCDINYNINSIDKGFMLVDEDTLQCVRVCVFVCVCWFVIQERDSEPPVVEWAISISCRNTEANKCACAMRVFPNWRSISKVNFYFKKVILKITRGRQCESGRIGYLSNKNFVIFTNFKVNFTSIIEKFSFLFFSEKKVDDFLSNFSYNQFALSLSLSKEKHEKIKP